MRQWCVLLLTNFIFSSLLYGQSRLKAVHRSIVYDSASINFFKHNLDVGHIVVLYENGKTKSLSVHFKTKVTKYGDPSVEFYVMSFPGDVYMFDKKYPQFRYENGDSLKNRFLGNIAGVNLADSIYTLGATFRPDSVTYVFEFFNEKAEEESIHSLRNRPYLKDKIEVLESKLSKKIKSWRPSEADSMIVFQGLVSREGVLKDLKILDGRYSDYTRELIKELMLEANPWWPVLHASKRTDWPVKLSVHLSKDMKISVSTL